MKALLMLLLLTLAIPVFAQDSPTTLPLPKNFCKGQIQFNYPLNWAIDTEFEKGIPGAQLIYAANSASEFAGGLNTPDPAHGNVVVFIAAMDAGYILHSYHAATGSPETVLNGMLSMPAFHSDNPQMSAIQ